MNNQRFRYFIAEFSRLVERAGANEQCIHTEGEILLADIVRNDDWLPDAYATPHPQYYHQNLLYCDPFERFSVVSFVWAPGQKTPVHDHTVWGLLGVLRGAELSTRFDPPTPGAAMRAHPPARLDLHGIDRVSPTVGDIHEVANAYADRVSISIHIYGANIGAVKRHVFDVTTGATKDFVSGYTNTTLPNVWDRSVQTRATN